MQKRPEDRPADAGRVLAALDGVLATTPVRAPAWRTTVAWVSALVLVAVGAGAGFWLAPASPQRLGPPAVPSAHEAFPPPIAPRVPVLLGAQVARDLVTREDAAVVRAPEDKVQRLAPPPAITERVAPTTRPKPAMAAPSISAPLPDASAHVPREIDTVAPY